MSGARRRSRPVWPRRDNDDDQANRDHGGHCVIPQLDAEPGIGILVLIGGAAAHARYLGTQGAVWNPATAKDDFDRALRLAGDSRAMPTMRERR